MLAGRSLLEWNIDEARSFHASEIVLVSAASKPTLPFAASRMPDVRVVDQDIPTGLGPAVAIGASEADGGALVLLPDTVFHPESPVRRMAEAMSLYDIVLPLEEVPLERVSLYGVVAWDEASGRIGGIVEKPEPAKAPSRWAIAGRFGLSRRALDFVTELAKGHSSGEHEMHLPPLLDIGIRSGLSAIGLPLLPSERRYDCGSPEGYEAAQIALERV